MPDGNVAGLPKGIKVVRKRLSDGTVATYRYLRQNGAPVDGIPGTPEFAANAEAAKATRRPLRLSLGARTYSNRLIDFADRVVERARFRAKARALPFDITPEYVKEIICQQDERCALTGLKFALSGPLAKPGPFHPSLDRIDSKGGYVRGNVRVVCFAVNIALREWGEAVFLKIAEAAVHTAWQRRPPY